MKKVVFIAAVLTIFSCSNSSQKEIEKNREENYKRTVTPEEAKRFLDSMRIADSLKRQ